MGAPVGNVNPYKGAMWKAAINRALERRSGPDRVAALDALAEKLLQLCEQGELGALKELGDRLDGKAAQAVMLSGDQENPVAVRAVIVPAKHPVGTDPASG